MYRTLTILFKNGGKQIINLHSSFSNNEKIRNRVLTPEMKAEGVAIDR